MTDRLVEEVVRATYQLSPAASGRLRRLTTASGLASENVLSRVAIVASLKQPGDVRLSAPHAGGKGKEIKGHTLLGRAGPASLLVAMVLRRHEGEIDTMHLRSLIVGHWERGIDILHDRAGGRSVVDQIATELAQGSLAQAPPGGRKGGHGDSVRDQVAAALGREFGRMPIEVRRLLAMAGRFDVAHARDLAARLATEVTAETGSSRISESQAIKVLAGWGLNRLGMNADDRRTMKRVLDAGEAGVAPRSIRRTSANFLTALGLVYQDAAPSATPRLSATPTARQLGEGSWLS